LLKYLVITRWIKEQIKSGQLSPGSKLYSETQLCKRFSVSRNTVRQALNQLEEENFIYRIQGSGTFISPSVSNLISISSKTIGVIITYANDYIFPYIINGITSKLSQYGYSVTLYVTMNRKDTERQILTNILNSNLDGLIIDPSKSMLPNVNLDLYQQIQKKIPCLFINCYYPDMEISHISPSNTESMQLAVDYLIKNGHSNIAGIFKSDDLQGFLRFDGYAKSLQSHNLTVNDSDVFWYTTENIAFLFQGSAGEYLLERLRTCTAIACYNDEISVQLVSFLRKNGFHLPQDLSIVSFDDALIARIDLPLTSAVHPKERIGTCAAESILTLIDDPSAQVTYEFPPELIQRDSVTRPKKVKI
jgi:GntR family transcriptional regulator of arabinose operon